MEKKEHMKSGISKAFPGGHIEEEKALPMGKNALVRQLSRIAFSSPNDAVALACGEYYGGIDEMDLTAVAEFKRREGQTEIKFLDRVKAMQVLWEILSEEGQGNETAMQNFLRALKEDDEEGMD